MMLEYALVILLKNATNTNCNLGKKLQKNISIQCKNISIRSSKDHYLKKKKLYLVVYNDRSKTSEGIQEGSNQKNGNRIDVLEVAIQEAVRDVLN